MLSFLRKWRKSLVDSGSARRYMVYAIGEIALVVIGILIALQINNWNDYRKDRINEVKMLQALKNDLTKNVENLNHTLERQRASEDRRNELVYIFEEYEFYDNKDSIVNLYKDTLGDLFMLGAYAFFREELVTGTYDAMIGAGKADLIQNQELVRLLAEYSAEIISDFEDHESQINFQGMVIEKSSPHLAAFWPWFNEDWSRFFYNDEKTKIKAIHNFLSDSSIEGILLPMSFGERSRRRRQSNLLKTTQRLIAMIDQELEKL